MTRRAATVVLVLALVALAAPLLAPYEEGLTFREYLHAPPMRSGLTGAHPLVLVDRLEQRYQADATRVTPLPWFSESKDDAPVFLLGSDNFGRDVMSRLLYGARTSIGLALVATFGAIVVGALAGTLAGYRGGWVDDTVMRIADFVLVLPTIYVALVLRAVLPLVLPTSTVFLLISGIFTAIGWPFVARGVRAIVSVERDREYVQAARSLGASHARVMLTHLMPACGGYLIVQAMLLLPGFILAEATLSYVGLGFPDTVASWGTMLIEAANISQAVRFPWTLAPAVAIFAVVFSTNLLTTQAGRPR